MDDTRTGADSGWSFPDVREVGIGGRSPLSVVGIVDGELDNDADAPPASRARR